MQELKKSSADVAFRIVSKEITVTCDNINAIKCHKNHSDKRQYECHMQSTHCNCMTRIAKKNKYTYLHVDNGGLKQNMTIFIKVYRVVLY